MIADASTAHPSQNVASRGLIARASARIARLATRYPAWLTWLAALVYVAGAIWRAIHTLWLNDPRTHIVGDALVYVNQGRAVANQLFLPYYAHILHPPATAWVYGFFVHLDPSLAWLVYFHLLVSALVPLAVGSFAGATYDFTAARWATIVASLYFPFIDLGSHFWTEIYMMLLNPLVFALFFAALRRESIARAMVFGGLAGLALSLVMAFKTVSLFALASAAAVVWVSARRPSRRVRTVALVATFFAAAPLSIALAVRCTQYNDGKFCAVTNRYSGDFLLGHYGPIRMMTWRTRGKEVWFGSPSAPHHIYTQDVVVDWYIADNEKNFAEAWKQIKAKPLQAVTLTLEHVADTYVQFAAYPTLGTRFWREAKLAQYFYIVFLLFPSGIALVDVWRTRGFLALVASRRFFVFAPLIGLTISVMIATGEARYRLPFDSVFILLSIDFFRSWAQGRTEARVADPFGPAEETP